jgi:hypothetical protein
VRAELWFGPARPFAGPILRVLKFGASYPAAWARARGSGPALTSPPVTSPAGFDPGCDGRRPHDVRAHRRHEGTKPPSRAIQSVAPRSPLEPPQVKERPTTNGIAAPLCGTCGGSDRPPVPDPSRTAFYPVLMLRPAIPPSSARASRDPQRAIGRRRRRHTQRNARSRPDRRSRCLCLDAPKKR